MANRGLKRIEKIGFTGTREGMTERQIEKLRELLEELGGREFHHGDCVGADEEAHQIARELGYRIVVHPPIKDVLRAFCRGDEIREPKEYLERNRAIVEECDVLVAAPKNLRDKKGGTWYTIRYAKRMGKKVIIIGP